MQFYKIPKTFIIGFLSNTLDKSKLYEFLYISNVRLF